MRPDWFDHAACHGHTSLFYPADGERKPTRIKRQAAAIKICAGCPVFDQCAALVAVELRRDFGAVSGIWAGQVYFDRADRYRQRAQSDRAQAIAARRTATRIAAAAAKRNKDVA
jgi:WhiB family redox-sensing transcriptional regulator